MTDDWRDSAACLGAPSSTMFPARGDMAGWRVAKAICARCPVITECKAEHLEERYGVFAGMSPLERQRERGRLERAGLWVRPRREPSHGTRSRYSLGCRCDECRDANATYGRGRRLA